MPQLDRAREFRVCKLADVNVWRLETLRRPRRWAFWLRPRWVPVVVWRLFDVLGEGQDAEYPTRAQAIEAMERFQRQDAEERARKANRWNCAASSEGQP
jgi:hypothetical protein